MKEKKRPQSWHDKIQQKMSERELGLVSHPSFYFTPGVPTEDGWYVVKKQNRREKNLYYETIYTDGRRIVTAELDYLDPILSHAKLPEL